MVIVVQILEIISTLLILAVIVNVVLSYFMSPYHPVRVTLDRIVEPMLRPIRKIVPPLQMIDFSPIILVILIQLVERLLVMILLSIG